MNKYKPFISAFFALLICSLAYSANHYSQLYKQADKDLKAAQSTIATMQKQQNKAAELDAKYTKDLADAQNTIDKLRDDVTAGNKRLSVRAKCVSKTTGSGSVVNADSAELDESARQDYYHLREMMNQQDKQIRYLQDYIRSVVNGKE